MVVVGIISILAVALLVAINPAEAQKKARDAQRIKDMATLQAIVEQYLGDNPGSTLTAATSSDGSSKACATSWLGFDACAYANVIPTDPSSRVTQVSDGTGAQVTQTAQYYLNYASGAYKVCTYLESTANAAKLGDDGGSDADRLEVFSGSVACE